MTGLDAVSIIEVPAIAIEQSISANRDASSSNASTNKVSLAAALPAVGIVSTILVHTGATSTT
jgi:hypothetical protein